MAEIAGVDHVSIVTDRFDARGCIEDYTRWVHLVAVWHWSQITGTTRRHRRRGKERSIAPLFRLG
jgi:CHASE2 domain-containing sensor protein